MEDGLAHTTLHQTFANPGSVPLEAIYEFPLPTGVTLTGVAVRTGDLRLEGVLVPKRRAQGIRDRILAERGAADAGDDAP